MKNTLSSLILGCALMLFSSIACTSSTESPTPIQEAVPTRVQETATEEPTLTAAFPAIIPTTLSNLEIDLETLNRVEPIYSIQATQGWIYNLAFSPDGSLLTGSTEQNEILIWDASDGRLLKTLSGHSARVMNIDFSHDGELLASSSMDQSIILWRMSDWEPIQLLEGHNSYVNVIAFSPNGRLIASGGEDRRLVVWSVDSGEVLFSSDQPILGVKDVAFSPDGAFLATASGETRVRVWDVETWELLLTLLGPTPQYRLAFSPDGSTLATAPWSIDADTWEPLAPIVFWDLEDGSRVGSSEVKTVALSLSYSIDGSLLFSGSDLNYKVRVWRTTDGALLLELMGHQDRVTSIAMNLDGTRIASAADDGEIIVWGVGGGEH